LTKQDTIIFIGNGKLRKMNYLHTVQDFTPCEHWVIGPYYEIKYTSSLFPEKILRVSQGLDGQEQDIVSINLETGELKPPYYHSNYYFGLSFPYWQNEYTYIGDTTLNGNFYKDVFSISFNAEILFYNYKKGILKINADPIKSVFDLIP
jgi:hypothetical protein